MAKRGRKPRPLAERFWEKVDKRGSAECWEWQGGRYANGYGMVRDDTVEGRGPVRRAHRVAVRLSGRIIPEGQIVMHVCDNRLCCNPAHLRVGTHAENMADRNRKGRQARGARAGNARLNGATVRAIRKAEGSHVAIASRYGISPAHVGRIKNRKVWKHLED